MILDTHAARPTLASTALMRSLACDDFERAKQAGSSFPQYSTVVLESENGHTTTFDILSRAANTLTHPTTWASNMLSLVSSSTSSSTPETVSSMTTESIDVPPVPSVTCITPPLLTLTEYNAFTDVTMTRRLSLSELSQPPYASWPPRQTRAVLCANAAACVSRTVAQGGPDPLQFMLPWVMDKRFMFPLPLDHQGRASFRSGRWWSRRNLGYEHIRPAPVHFVMRKKLPSLPAEDLLEEDSSNGWTCVESSVGDETLDLDPTRQGTLPSPATATRPNIVTIREAALAMARAGHERVITRRNSLSSEQGQSIPVGLQSNPDHAFAHITDSDSDLDMDGDEAVDMHKTTLTEVSITVHRPQLPPQAPSVRRSYSPSRAPSIRGRSSSLRRVAISADESALTNVSTDDLNTTDPATPCGSSKHRRIFAQRWHLNDRKGSSSRSREHSLDGGSSQDSDDSDDSFGMYDHCECASDHSSETSEEDSLADSDDLDCPMSVLPDVFGKNSRSQLLGTVFEDDDGMMGAAEGPTRNKALQSSDNPTAFRHASFFIVDTPEEEVENRVLLKSSMDLLQRTQAIEDLQSHSKIPTMHTTTAAMHTERGKGPRRHAISCSGAPAPFAAAVLSRPIPKVHMPGLHGGVALRRPGGAMAAAAAQPLRTVYLDTNPAMDWEPQAV
ncbi:hypothetical protein A4X13_0g7628 [Tilletia indica]|uniref:Uncharacterized protein n=1 Tax=Tilletia indica TaxID=43049 RepID=A0A177TU17_9BASI|nr:hypothetical protein A4X13_0g7628 [Tilletia indica]